MVELVKCYVLSALEGSATSSDRGSFCFGRRVDRVVAFLHLLGHCRWQGDAVEFSNLSLTLPGRIGIVYA
jgi:hypothetical protein